MTVSDLHMCHFHALETKRLLLRPLTIGDAEDMFSYTSIPDSFRFLRREPHRSVEEDQSFIKGVLEGYREHREFVWGIVSQERKHIIGTCRLFDIHPGDCCEVSYLIHPAHQGQNIASEAVRRLICYSFEDLNLTKVYARCAVENIGSERVMLKCGMRREAVLFKYAELHGIQHDFLLYAIENNRVIS